MNEKALQILEQYDIKLLRSFGGRGAIMLETEQGLKLLKEFAGSKTKLPYEQMVLAKLEQEGVCQVDRAVANLEGELISQGEYDTTWLIKNWPSGKECDTHSEADLLKSMEVLARIHQTARGIWGAESGPTCRLLGNDRRTELEKHNRELKRVQNFIRSKRRKGSFELLFLKYARQIMEDGVYVLGQMASSDYEQLWQKAKEEGHICHGEYIHHNIFINRQSAAVVNFQRCEINVQINDLCLFLRKIMEKQNWNESLALRMLHAYETARPLSETERFYLAACLYYPEKVWKLAHHYYNANKAWIPEKSTEKQEVFLEQEAQRKKMIKHTLQFGP